jgi:hypothetical protein
MSLSQLIEISYTRNSEFKFNNFLFIDFEDEFLFTKLFIKNHNK